MVAAVLVLVGFVGVLAAAGALSGGRPVSVPVWAVAEIEARMNRALLQQAGAEGALSLGGVTFGMASGDAGPEMRITDLRWLAPGGATLARLPEVRAGFDGAALLTGAVRPTWLRLTGPQITLRRGLDGRIDLAFGDGLAGARPPASFGALMAAVDDVFDLPALAGLRAIEAEAATITLEDRRARRVWTMGDGRIALLNSDDAVTLDLGVGLVGGGAAPATARLTFVTARGNAQSRLSARVDQVAAADLAAQSPLLAFLAVIDAPLSGDLRADFDAAGGLAGLEGALALGAGALRPVEGAAPVAFESARIAFAHDAARGRMEFPDLAFDSSTLRLAASGHAYLPAPDDPAPAFLGQVRLHQVWVDPEGLFTEPVHFSDGAFDLRLRLDPFSVDLGQLALVEQGRRLLASGRLAAGPEGWIVALDLELDAIRHDRLLALWPLRLVPRTRDWLAQNVQEGLLFDVRAALRLRPGSAPVLSLRYEFADADVRFIRTLPPIEGGHGHATIDGQTYTMVLDRGRVTPPEGGEIAVTRSMFRVPDITEKPPRAEVRLDTDSSVTAALSLLDQPPFGFLTRARLGVDLAQGRATVRTDLRLRLMDRIAPADVEFEVTGALRDVVSDRLAPGRVIAADRLDLRADPGGITIAGQGRLGRVPFDAAWRQDFLPPSDVPLPLAVSAADAAVPADRETGPRPASDAAPEMAPDPVRRGPGSTVRGSLTLSEAFAAEFLSGLPPRSLQGEGRASFEIALDRDAVPRFSLTSDLRGVAVRIDDIGWSLPAATPGRLEVAGRLSAPAAIDRLLLEAPGLLARGSVELRPDGTMGRLVLSDLRLGDWLRGVAEITGQGPGRPPKVALLSGNADLRRLPPARTAGAATAAGAPAAGGPVTVALDRVTVTGGIDLTGFRGTFTTGARSGGSFTGRINGTAPVTGQMEATARGNAFRIRSDLAGEVLAAAGLFPNAFGGKLDLTLFPTGQPGSFDGNLAIADVRVRNMPVLAELLNAISIVGLLEQLGSSGLLFHQAQAVFRLTPDGVNLTQAAAVGASIGVSLEGVYDSRREELDLRGVISPVYLVNSIGAFMTRPGEGVFGFNYRVRGPAAAPRVTVNPLSVLAPGFVREIFRRPAATLDPP